MKAETRKRLLTALAWAFMAWPARAEQVYDLIIQGGRIVDGAGNAWYVADVGVRDGRIAAIGTLDASLAGRVLDAHGRVVAPGFIDVHTHAESGIRRIPTADNFVFDGVTTLVTGNCGNSETDLPRFFGELKSAGASVNLATLIGHGSVRRKVMGSEERDPSAEELARMESLVEEAMLQGALGLSTGLIYVPGTYAKTPELVALAKVSARHGGLYASHIRNEGETVFTAIDEALQIGRDAALPVEISHFKVAHKRLWGESKRTLAQVEKARSEGLDVTVDQYPYTASSTNLGVLLPAWALSGGQEELQKRLTDPATRRRIALEMKDEVRKRNGQKALDYVVVASCPWDTSLDGKSLTRINRSKGRTARLEDEIQTVLDLVEKGAVQVVFHSMEEGDVRRILSYPNTMVGSDSGVLELDQGVPHPRGYGSHARILARYVRETPVLRLEEAIRKMTSLPAQRFRLTDRGLLRPGMWADVVVFDPVTVTDRATFEKPHAYSEGFAYVLVNGQVVVDGDRHTGARPGQVLLGPGVPEAVAPVVAPF